MADLGKMAAISGVTGGRSGQSAPPRLLTRKFLLTYREKRGKEKKGKGVFGISFVCCLFCFVLFCFFFFSFCFSLLKTTETCFGSTRMGIFYRKKTFHAGKKSGKMTLPPQKNMPVTPLAAIHMPPSGSTSNSLNNPFIVFIISVKVHTSIR